MSSAGLLSCAAAEGDPARVEAAAQGLTGAEEAAVAKTRAPIRSLQMPGNVYMTSIEQTIATAGNFPYIVHVYQPDATAEGIRFEVAARTSGGAVDTGHTFQSVNLTSRPGEAGETQQTLANGSGQKVYTLATSRQGWYRFSFTHGAPSGGRTLSVKAYDAAGNALKMAWNDPPGVNAQVRVRLAVTQSSNVYLKGGAYRNTDPSQSAFADNVKVNGTLLYRRSFDQGRYNFPLGQLNAGQHTLEFSLSSSGGTPKYWFGVNEKSFDTLGTKSAWDPVQFLYYGSMRTGDYDAWSDGVAFAQSSTVPGSRPPPVRRGTTFSVTVAHPSLNTGNAVLRVKSVFGSEFSWTKTLPSGSDYTGGIFVAGAPSGRNRENWRITVPSNAPVGRYVLSAFAPDGAQIGNSIQFYVIHNPYALLASGAISKAELEAYGYDEDEDGVLMQGPYGPDRDNLRDHFSAFYDGSLQFGYTPTTMLTGSFRRTQGETFASMLDIAAASADETTTEFESMLRLYRIVAQRIKYNRPAIPDDSSDTMIGGENGLDPSLAFWFSLPGLELDTHSTGQCFEYGTVLTALARSAGILARPVSSSNWLAGWGNHVFTEVYIPGVPQHGGKRTSSNSSGNSDTDHWYVFDSTDPNGTGVFPRTFTAHSEAVAPRAQFGRAAVVLQGSTIMSAIDAVTNPTTWDPLSTATVGASGVTTVTAAYTSGPEFWLTTSGVTGWVGYGEKDVYRISKTLTGARAVRVSVASGGSGNLNLKLCVGSVANSPVMPDRCANAAASYPLPAGDSYVVVFNDTEDMPARYLRGDVAKYVLDLEF